MTLTATHAEREALYQAAYRERFGQPGLFDLDPQPVKGKQWPWPTPAGFETVSHDHCTAVGPGWHYCHRDRGHTGPHAECNSVGNVTAVWGPTPPAPDFDLSAESGGSTP